MDNSILLAGIMLGILFLVGSGLAFLYYMNYERGSFITSSYVDSESMPRQLDLQGHDPNIACLVLSSQLWKTEELGGKTREYYGLYEPLVKFLKQKKFKEVRTLDERGNIDANWQGKLGKHPVTIYVQAGETGTKFDLYLHHERVMKVGDLKIYVPQEIKEAAKTFGNEMLVACLSIAKWEPEVVSKETNVFSLVNDSTGSLGLAHTPTSSLFKYGRIVHECPAMFSLNVKASYNGVDLKTFPLKGACEFIKDTLIDTDAPVSGILFGEPGLGKSSILDALAWYLGRNPKLMVIRVNGPAIADAAKTATLTTLINQENDRGRKPVILIDELDDHFAITNDVGGKSGKGAALMSLQNGITVIGTCNLSKDQIHPAFLREMRGNFQIHLNTLDPSQVPIISAYIKSRAEKDEKLVFTPWVGKGIPTLAQLWAQLQHRSIINMLAGKWAELESVVADEHAADDVVSEPTDNDWDKVPTEIPEVGSEVPHSRNPNRRRR